MKRLRLLSLISLLLGPTIAGEAAPATPNKPPAKAGALPSAPALAPGVVSAAIPAERQTNWTYHVYLPKAFDASRKWPALFVMSPGGGNKATLTRYIAGAELNQWILFASVQSRNGFEDSEAAVLAMVDDATQRFPLQKGRLYASGFSGGARMALWLVAQRKKDFAGVIPCGAGDTEAAPDLLMYGLCGSNCFNRWDMACTMKRIRNSDSRLQFFSGNHDWAQEPLITDAMTHLNCVGLRAALTGRRALVAERKRFIEALMAKIESSVETQPAYACALASSMARMNFQDAPRAKLSALLLKLRALPDVQKHNRAQADLDRFVLKRFGTTPMGFQTDNANPVAAKEAEKLAEQHKDTEFGPLFTRLGQKSVRP